MNQILPRIGAWALLLCVGLLCAACATVLGDDYTIRACSEEATCSDCISCSAQAQCQTQFNACAASSECLPVQNCITSCPTDSGYSACVSTCEGDHPAGAVLNRALIACTCSACSTLCACM